jgi:uncharacterized protein (DUF885 family)
MAAMGGMTGPAIADVTTPDEFSRAWARLASPSEPIEPKDRLAAILDLAWREAMVESPESATLVGEPGRNDRWSDRSPAAIARRRARPRDIQAALAAVDRSRLDPGDRLNHDLYLHDLEDELAAGRFPREWLAVTQLSGPQQEAARVLALAPAATPADYRDQVARLRGIGRLVDETIALLEAGLDHGVTPPRVTLRDVPAQALSQIPDDPWTSPLLAAFTRFPSAFPEGEREALRSEAARAYREVAVPAFRRLHEFLAVTYIPRTRETIACRSLPEGEAWYAWLIRHHTTTALDARAIHDLGLAEVRRLRAAMEAVIREVGFKGTFAGFAAFLRSDPRFFFTDPDALVKEYRDIVKRADPELVRLFGRLPRLPYGVVPVPDHAAASQTTAYYEPGSPEAGRPGYYFVNTWNLAARPKWEMEALSLHEAVPGHHLQIALAQELTGLPKFRRYGGTTAFVEGWALYAESLGHEMGMYRDPYARFGQLTYEMWRAIRLVVDTGLHAFGWSREQAIEFFRDNSAKTEHDIVVEIDRYIVDPGQALAYKIGELRIRALRASLAAALGPRFDLRAFHDAVLENGALPLGVLEERLRSWAAERRAAP